MAPRVVFVTGVLSALIGVAGAVVAVDLAQRLLFLGSRCAGSGRRSRSTAPSGGSGEPRSGPRLAGQRGCRRHRRGYLREHPEEDAVTSAEEPVPPAGADPYATSTEPDAPDEPGDSAAEPHAEGGGLVPPAGEVDPLPGSPYGTSTGLR